MVAEPNDANLPDRDWGIPRSTLSVRIPSWAHKRMKAEARETGATAADLYATVIERFLDDEIQQRRRRQPRLQCRNRSCRA